MKQIVFGFCLLLLLVSCSEVVKPPCSHDWDWVETKAPTATEEGEETYTCLVCGATGIKRPVPAVPMIITSVKISIGEPVNGGLPSTAAATDDTGYTLSAVSWSPDDNFFRGGGEYTATVTLTANSGYTFNGLNSAVINGQSAETSNNTGTAVTVYKAFTTPTKTPVGLTIKTQPDKLAYTHSDLLDLAGLEVTLEYDDTTADDIIGENFEIRGITSNPAQGDGLVHLTHNGQPVTVTYNGSIPFSANTDNLTVSAKAITFTIDDIPAVTYNGNAHTPEVKVKDGTKELSLTADYTAAYSDNTNAGTASVTITGVGNYAGSTGSGSFVINPKVITFAVDAITAVTYTGNAHTPEVKVWDGTKELSLTADYTVAYSGNINAGTATVNITGVGNYAGSTGNRSFTINPKVITFAVDAIPTQIYTGNAITPEVTVWDGSAKLTITTGYTAAYSNNINAGTASVTITGVGNYAGSTGSASFTILQTVSPDRIEYYWVDEHGSLVTTSGGVTTIAAGVTLTITAQGTGYDVKQWYLNGGKTDQSGNTYNFSSATLGKHTVSLFVEKDGKPYNSNIIITVIPLISITTHPTSRTVAAGSISGNISVTATVTFGATLSYQWYRNTSNSSTGGTVINGATNSTYTIPTNLTAGTYYYFCEVMASGATSVRSNVAIIHVATTLTANTWRNGNIDLSGGEQWYRFTATSSTQYVHVSFGTLTDLNIQVYDNSINTIDANTRLSGTTRSILRTLTSGQVYFIRVTPYSSTGSGTYLIAFNTSTTAPASPTISITTHPTSRTVAAGYINSNLTVAATVSPTGLTLGYQWYSNTSNSNTGGTAISGETSSTFTIPTNLTAGTRYYFCEVRVVATTVRSNVATVTVITTTSLTANTYANGNITSAGGQQWFRFTATLSQQYIYVTFGTLNDLYIQLYNSNFNTFATEMNLYNNTRGFSVDPLTIGAVYYIRVRPYYSSGSGTYQIRFGSQL